MVWISAHWDVVEFGGEGFDFSCRLGVCRNELSQRGAVVGCSKGNVVEVCF
jgi:hypothetical protein